MEINNTFTQGRILKPLILFALPVLLALFLQAMYGAVDLLIVGKFASSADVSAVSTGSQIMMTLTNLVSSFAMGTTVLLGQQIGCGERKQGGRTVGTAIVMFTVIALVMTAVLVIFAPQVSSIMNAPEEAFDKTVAYVRICGGGMLVIVAYNLIGCIFRGIGDSRTPLFTVAVACVFNIAGDLILCAGFKMGTSGAAFATVFAQVISVIVSFGVIRKKDLPFEMHKTDIGVHGRTLRKMVGLGAYRIAGSPGKHFLSDHPGYCEFHGSNGICRCWRCRKSLCVYHADLICVYAVHFCFCGAELRSGTHGPGKKSSALWCGGFFCHWCWNVFPVIFPWKCAGGNFFLRCNGHRGSGRLPESLCH